MNIRFFGVLILIGLFSTPTLASRETSSCDNLSAESHANGSDFLVIDDQLAVYTTAVDRFELKDTAVGQSVATYLYAIMANDGFPASAGAGDYLWFTCDSGSWESSTSTAESPQARVVSAGSWSPIGIENWVHVAGKEIHIVSVDNQGVVPAFGNNYAHGTIFEPGVGPALCTQEDAISLANNSPILIIDQALAIYSSGIDEFELKDTSPQEAIDKTYLYAIMSSDGEPAQASADDYEWYICAGGNWSISNNVADSPQARIVSSGAWDPIGWEHYVFTNNVLIYVRSNDLDGLVPAFGEIYQAGSILNGYSCEDCDFDGIPDVWEINGIDIDGDGAPEVDLPAMGADPNRKDIFVEIDWLEKDGLCDIDALLFCGSHRHKPSQKAINKVIAAFNAVGISLHVDAGPDSLLNPLTDPDTTWGSLGEGQPIDETDELEQFGTRAQFDADRITEEPPYTTIKSAHFLEARRGVFHYNLWVHSIADTKRTGYAELPGDDFFVAFPDRANISEQAGTFMHELGHNLNLGHGGDEDTGYKPNYLSVMNYLFQFTGLRIDGDDGEIDYSHHKLDPLNEAELVEGNGISPASGVGQHGTRYYCFGEKKTDDIPSSIDWDCDGVVGSGTVKVDINDGEKNGLTGDEEILTGHDDWENLEYRGGAIGSALGDYQEIPSTIPNELDLDEASELGLLETEVSPSIHAPSIVYVIAGTNSEIPIELVNGGTESDTFELHSQSDATWINLPTSSRQIGLTASESKKVLVNVAPPLDAAESQSSISLSIKSTKNPNAEDDHVLTVTVIENLDLDGDGIENNADRCPTTNLDEIVNNSGCSISQMCPSDRGWKNHGQYVSCVTRTAKEFQKLGLISKNERKRTILEASRSDIGKK